ncbi:MAG: hypothetical protein C0501_30405 [Isosphaera sp.]|nr:hypothetical protein [Isosphaera sp.]
MIRFSEKTGARFRIVLRRHHPHIFAAVGFVVALVVLLVFAPVGLDTYRQLRGSLFTGLFAVSGFLLSAKSLVILNLKKEVYGEDWYLTRVHERDWSGTAQEHKRDKTPRKDCGATTDVYRPLAQVGALLTVNIILALLASFAQITLGLAETSWAVAVCLASAVAAAVMLGCSVYLMWLSFEKLYADWEAIAQAKLEKKWSDAVEDFGKSEPRPAPGSLKKVKTVEADEPIPPS